MREAIFKLDEKLAEHKTQEPLFVPDGAVDVDRYISSSPRILWILKEVNGPGEWDLRTHIRNTFFSYSRWSATYGLIIRVSYGLLKGCLEWGNWADDPRSLADCLRDISVININKRGGGPKSDPKVLKKAGIDFGQLITGQVSALKPNIVILGGTFDFLPSNISDKLTDIRNAEHKAVFKDGMLFISAYHPGQSTINHEKYYKQVITAVGAFRLSLPRNT